MFSLDNAEEERKLLQELSLQLSKLDMYDYEDVSEFHEEIISEIQKLNEIIDYAPMPKAHEARQEGCEKMALEGFEVVEDEVRNPSEVSEKNFYEREYEEIKKNEEKNIWKPETGIYTVKLVSELNKFVFKKDGEEKERAAIDIEINKEKLVWFMGVGKSEKSVYGKLVYLGKAWGTLKGKTIEITVEKDKDNKRSFSIREYIKEKQKEKETSP